MCPTDEHVFEPLFDFGAADGVAGGFVALDGLHVAYLYGIGHEGFYFLGVHSFLYIRSVKTQNRSVRKPKKAALLLLPVMPLLMVFMQQAMTITNMMVVITRG